MMQMKLKHTIRCVSLAACCGGFSLCAQAQLPPTQPTQPASATLPVAVPAAQLTRAVRTSHRAQVTYTDGKLQVLADDSSLNQILREIARATGMKITGGVEDERVFGKYGPAPPGQILASLLDGTGSNMLLVETAKDAPAELILTSRHGGPTPPNPNATRDDDDQPPPSQQSTVPPPIQATQPVNQTPSASGFVSAPTSHPETEPGTTPGPSTQATGTSDPQPDQPAPSGQSPNGVKTPEQIFQQLQQLRQQQQQQAAPQ
jgi:hypothetical protein